MKKILLTIFIISSLFLFADPPQWQQISGTQFSMLLRTQVSHQNILFENNGDNLIAAFGPGGENDCRAIGFWIDPYPPYYEEGFWHLGIVSNLISGEEIEFKIYDSAQDQVYQCIQTIYFEDNITIGSPYEPYLLSTATGQITGFVEVDGGGEPNHVLIEAGGISTYPQENEQSNWIYSLELPPGVYDVHASLLGYQDSTLYDVPVTADQTTDSANFFLFQSQDPLLYLPEFTYGALNQDVYIPVYIDMPTGYQIEGINLNISYDEDILVVESATLDGGILEDQDYNFGVNLTQPGNIQLGFSANNNLFQGDGVICWLNCSVNQQAQPGNNCELQFVQAEINEITVPSEGGNFIVLNYAYSISGNVHYFSSQEAINNSQISLSGNYNFNVLSDEFGNYEITSIPEGNFTLSADKSSDLQGLSGLDASRVFRYSIGLYDFGCSEMIAADVTLDGSISGTDASRIARYAAGLIDSLNNFSHWMFVPEEIENCSQWPPIEYETQRYFNPLDQNQTNQDFIGIKLGDVSGNWTSQSSQILVNRDDPQGILPDIEAGINETLLIPLTINELENLEGMDIRILFNPNVMTVTDVSLENSVLDEMNYGIEVNTSVTGELTLIYYANSSLYSGSGVVGYIEGQIIGSAGSFSNLDFDMFSINEVDYIANTVSGSVTISNSDSNNEEIPNLINEIRITPNPFNPKTEISFYLNEKKEMQLNIYNAKGRIVESKYLSNTKQGRNSFIWDGTDTNGLQVTSGLYIFEIKGLNYRSVKKGMLLK